MVEHQQNMLKVGRSSRSPSYFPIIWGQKLGKPECPYMRRWVIDFKLFSLRLHHWYSSDDQRFAHDHAWNFITIVLKGSYEDISDNGSELLQTGSLRYRTARHRHKVKVPPSGCWTFLITGSFSRRWGFWVKEKFIEQRRYFFKFGNHPCE